MSKIKQTFTGPKSAWDILWETLALDADSGSFDPELRKKISEARSEIEEQKGNNSQGDDVVHISETIKDLITRSELVLQIAEGARRRPDIESAVFSSAREAIVKARIATSGLGVKNTEAKGQVENPEHTMIFTSDNASGGVFCSAEGATIMHALGNLDDVLLKEYDTSLISFLPFKTIASMIEELDENGVYKHTVESEAFTISMVQFVAAVGFGCFVAQHNGALISSAMQVDGTMETNNINEVSAPETQEFLDEVNRLLDTNYKLEDFPGR